MESRELHARLAELEAEYVRVSQAHGAAILALDTGLYSLLVLTAAHQREIVLGPELPTASASPSPAESPVESTSTLATPGGSAASLHIAGDATLDAGVGSLPPTAVALIPPPSRPAPNAHVHEVASDHLATLEALVCFLPLTSRP